MRAYRRVVTLLALVMLLLLSGCAAFGVDGLYALPMLSDDSIQLQELIDEQLQSGGEYAAPVSGSNRQSVQHRDLDGDGIAEAIAFLADETHTPTICIYRLNEQGEFYLYVIIRGEGSSVGSVEYADLTGDGSNELIVLWQIGGDLQLLSVYTLREDSIRQAQTELLNADSSDFLVCDLDGDGVDELIDLCVDYGGTSTLVRYLFDGGTRSEYDARLSGGISDVLRLRTGYLSDGTTALFVESAWGSGGDLITDVFTASGGLTNITITASGRSDTLRDGSVYCQDINSDRATELPETEGDVIYWYGLDAGNGRALKATTYHDFTDGWYLTLSGALLSGKVTAVRTEDFPGEAALTLSVDGKGMLVIYTLTGENRLDRAAADGRFLLTQNETTVYAAMLLPHGEALDAETIVDDFSLIYPEWQTGERK